MPRVTVYRAVPLQRRQGAPELWGIMGGWRTINSTMGLYPSKAQAEAAIRRMVKTRELRTIRKIPKP